MKCVFNVYDISDNVHDLFNLWIPKFNKIEKSLVMVIVVINLTIL